MLIKDNPFKKMPISQALSLLEYARDGYLDTAVNRRLYDGDHWMSGDGWIGPIPAESQQMYDDIKAEVFKAFCSKNVVREVVDRKVDGLLKSRPQMTYYFKENVKDKDGMIPDPKQKLIDEATNLFRVWFKKKKILKRLKEVYGRSQLNERVTSRLYIPKGLLSRSSNGSTKVPPGTIEECLDLIHLSIELNDSAGEIVHPETQLTAAVCDVVAGENRYTELVYVEGSNTIVRTVWNTIENGLIQLSPAAQKAMDENQGTEWVLELGGRLTMFQPRIRPTITQQVRENQYAINLAKTMQNRNTVVAGFLERIVLDAMPPGKWIDDPSDPNKQIYEVGPFKLGAGTTNFFMAAEYRNDDTGESHYGNPSVYIKEPSPPSTFIESKRDCYQDILEEVGQPHILISGDATSSAKSRETAKDTYRGTLEDDEGELIPMIEWLMETTISMAAFLAGGTNKGHFEELAAQAKCYLNLGPLTGNERQDNREDVKAGQVSVRTSMMRSGVEDPQAEFDRISEEAGMTDEAIRNKIDIAEKLVKMGFEEEGTLDAVGLPKVKIDKLKLKPKSERMPQPPTPQGLLNGKAVLPGAKLPQDRVKNPPNRLGKNRGGAPMN